MPALADFPSQLSASWRSLAKVLALTIVIAIPMLVWPAFLEGIARATVNA